MCLHVFFLTFSVVRLYFACNVANEATLIFSAVLLVGLPGGRRRFGWLGKAAGGMGYRDWFRETGIESRRIVMKGLARREL
jgi:hypothetical protein